MKADFIHVTRWDNQHKVFVDVGLLCESDDLEKSFPAVSFNYTDGYLDKYAPLYPRKLLRPDSSTLINDADYNATLPKIFTPYLPNHTMKEVLSSMISDFEDMTPFQQLKSIAEIKGDFGSVQLNYNNETQFNSLPQNIEDAARLLEIMRNKDYEALVLSDVNAIYDYNKHNPSIRMVRWNDDESYCIATVTQVEGSAKAKQAIVMQGVMQASGIDVLEINVESHDDMHFLVQYDLNERISGNRANTVIEDSIHIQPLLSSAKYISDETNLCAAEVSNLCKSIGGKASAKEIYARSVIAQVMNQRDFNIKQVKFREVGGILKLSPQVVNPILEDDSVPFQLPLVSGQSNYVQYMFKENVSPMLARSFGITSRQQVQIIDRINDALSSVEQIALSKGVSVNAARPIQKIHEKSGLFKIPTKPQAPNSMPSMD